MRFFVMALTWSICVGCALGPLHLPMVSFIGMCGLLGIIFTMIYKIAVGD